LLLVYFARSKVTTLRVIPLSAQFGITRQGVNTTNRSPLSVKFRTCLVPTHSGFQATSTLVVHRHTRYVMLAKVANKDTQTVDARKEAVNQSGRTP
jgi:hypothetical protein